MSDIATFKGRATVYTILGCTHCAKAKMTLNELGVPYKEIRLDLFPHIQDKVIEKSGLSTVPQIYFNNVFIGGNDDLNNLKKNVWEDMLYQLKNTIFPEGSLIIPDENSAILIDETDDFQCKCEESVNVLNELKNQDIIGLHRVGLRFFKHSFTGLDFLNWAVKAKHLDKTAVSEIGQTLLDRKLINSVNKSKVFLPTFEVYQIALVDTYKALNNGQLSCCEPRSVTELGGQLRKLILKIYAKFLSEDGKSVDYDGMKSSEDFERYIKLTKELVRLSIDKSSREEKLAFFINVYNALVIHAMIEKGQPTSLIGRYKFFNDSKYIIGGSVYSLQDIENGILRANRRGIGSWLKPFGKNDPRLKVSLDRHEPLVHFALVCGAKSCPPIKTYTPENIYKELQLATSAFLEGDNGCQVDVANHTIRLSALFKWYQVDFGKNNTEILEFVMNHMQKGQKLKDITTVKSNTQFNIQFLPYDWSSNSKL